MLGADPKRTCRLTPCFEPCNERIARLDNFTIDDVASHKGVHPAAGEPATGAR